MSQIYPVGLHVTPSIRYFERDEGDQLFKKGDVLIVNGYYPGVSLPYFCHQPSSIHADIFEEWEIEPFYLKVEDFL